MIDRHRVDPHLVCWTGAIAFVGAVLAGLGWLDALRDGVRAIFGAGCRR